MYMNSGIYKIINKVTGGYYVGSSKDIESRWKSHKSMLRKCKHRNNKLQTVWNEYGEDCFEFNVIEYIDCSDGDRVIGEYKNDGGNIRRVEYYLNRGMILNALLLIEEQKYLNIARVDGNSYQQCYKADGGECSDSTKKLISNSLKGRVFSDEHRRKIGEANRNRIYSDDTRRKIGQSSSNRTHSQITKDKIAEKCKLIDHDKTIYKFINNKTKEEFIGTRNGFRFKYSYSHDGVRKIIRGKYKTYPVWSVQILSNTVSAIH